MNNVVLMGRLVRDPEIRYSTGTNQMAVAKFTLAVDRRYKKEGEQTADFINCTAFGKVAEVIEKHVTKGVKIAVAGEWRTGSYTDKNGNKVYTNDCNVIAIDFCESKNANQLPEKSPAAPANDGFINVPTGLDDELPFA